MKLPRRTFLHLAAGAAARPAVLCGPQARRQSKDQRMRATVTRAIVTCAHVCVKGGLRWPSSTLVLRRHEARQMKI
jgi:hypothetical protein